MNLYHRRTHYPASQYRRPQRDPSEWITWLAVVVLIGIIVLELCGYIPRPSSESLYRAPIEEVAR